MSGWRQSVVGSSLASVNVVNTRPSYYLEGLTACMQVNRLHM